MSIMKLLLLFLLLASAALYGCAGAYSGNGGSSTYRPDYDYSYGYGYWGSPLYNSFPYYPYGSWGGVDRNFGYFRGSRDYELRQRHEEMERGEMRALIEGSSGWGYGSFETGNRGSCGALTVEWIKDYCNRIK